MRGAPVVLLVAALSGCAGSYDRTSYVLDGHRGLIWSNSPVVTGRREPELFRGDLAVNYHLLFENTGPEPADLLLSRAMASVGGEPHSSSCECFLFGVGPVEVAPIVAGQRVHVYCFMLLKSISKRILAKHDAPLVLVIPVVHGNTVLAAAFTFQLRGEDVQ